MPMISTMNRRAESPAQRAAGPRCADDSAWRENFTLL
jgi:hypothetical protein